VGISGYGQDGSKIGWNDRLDGARVVGDSDVCLPRLGEAGGLQIG
jgi:hypothetical protein